MHLHAFLKQPLKQNKGLGIIMGYMINPKNKKIFLKDAQEMALKPK